LTQLAFAPVCFPHKAFDQAGPAAIDIFPHRRACLCAHGLKLAVGASSRGAASSPRSKDEPRGASWFETAQVRLLTMSSTQSNPETVRRHAGLDCFVACALRNDESNFARTAALPWTRLRPGIRIKPNGPAFAPAVKSRSPSPAIG
jgi:hypothetical protein